MTRVAHLSDRGRAALEAAAVIGSRIEPWLLASVADAGAADESVTLGLLVSRGPDLSFRHELGREALLESLPPLRAQTLHRAVLDALEANGSADPARLAHHAESAGDAPAVLSYAREAAARAAAASANREAAAQLGRALRFVHHLSDAEQITLLERYARAQALVGRFDETERVAEGLVERSRRSRNPLTEGRMLNLLAGCLVTSGRNEEGEEASRQAIRTLETLPPGEELAAAYSTQAGLRMLDRDCAEAVVWADRALAIAEPGGHLDVRLQSYERRGAALLLLEDERGRADLEKSIDLARQAGLPKYVASAYSQLGSIAGEHHQLDLAERHLSAGLEVAREHELDSTAGYMGAWLALVFLFQGRWAEAEDSARQLLRLFALPTISRVMATLALGRVLTRRGDAEGPDVLDRALELALPTGTLQRLGPVRAARAEAAALRGDLETVRREARAALDLALAHRHRWITGELLMWLARSGERVEAPDWIALPYALELRGEGRPAFAEWRRLGFPYEAERALIEVGDEAQLRSSLEALVQLGARPLAQQCAQRLRSIGARGVPRGPRHSTAHNPAQLTTRQVEIVRLVAQGLQNAEIGRRLFISAKTVDHHVSASLAKLGVRSRTEVALAAARLGLLRDREPPPKT
jgi:DNA-binding CsgD family transcriptional regulator